MRHLSIDGLFGLIAYPPHAQVLDVRLGPYPAATRIRGAYHVPWLTPAWTRNPDFLARVLECLAREDHVLVICRDGQISCEAAAMLEQSGFRHVYNVLGGYEEIERCARPGGVDLLLGRGAPGGHDHEPIHH